jgi:DNA-binding MltR family transcriptional regulator
MTKIEESRHFKAWMKSWLDIIEEFGPDTNDRTIVIVGAALLDTHLEQLIASFLIDEKNQVAELLNPERPLGSFGARIRTAYCLGLISKGEYHDLRIIQKVRNDFAHKLDISFSDNSIKDRCNTLKLAKTSPPSLHPPEPRDSFISATIALGSHLAFRIAKAERDRRVVPSDL